MDRVRQEMGYNSRMRTKIERITLIPPLILGIALLIVGFLALNHIVDNWWPFDVARLDLVRATTLDRADAALLLEAADFNILLAFFASIVAAITGLTMPLAHILGRRFGQFTDPVTRKRSYPPLYVTLRQAMGIGIWVAFCTWLQMNRAFGMAIAVLVLAVIVLFEMLMQVRARAGGEEDEAEEVAAGDQTSA